MKLNAEQRLDGGYVRLDDGSKWPTYQSDLTDPDVQRDVFRMMHAISSCWDGKGVSNAQIQSYRRAVALRWYRGEWSRACCSGKPGVCCPAGKEIVR